MCTDEALLRQAFIAGYTRSYQWRMGQLRSLLDFLTNEEPAILDALHADLNREVNESLAIEVARVRTELKWALKHLQGWMEPQAVKSFAPLFAFHSKYIIHEPLGTVLIASPWNYPFALSLIPLIGSIAAGNCTILKPSELCVASSQLLYDRLPKYLDDRCTIVKLGGADVVTSLIDSGFIDHIVFIGSTAVGKIIAKAAAAHMIPVTLECGGKCPAVVWQDCDPNKAAKSICSGKFANAGQTCIAPDYVIVHESVAERFTESLRQVIASWYPNGTDLTAKHAKSFGKIISKSHFERLMGLLRHGSADVIVGGNADQTRNVIFPTVVKNLVKDGSHPLMKDEIFGPILPILEVKNIREAVKQIRNRHGKPLAIYVYTNNRQTVQCIVDQTSSGCVSVNDCVIHHAMPGIPFGGVGNSGFGKLNWHFSFERLSNIKAVTVRSSAIDRVMETLCYPPLYDAKIQRLRYLMEGSAMCSVILRQLWVISKHIAFASSFACCGFFIGYNWRSFHFGL